MKRVLIASTIVLAFSGQSLAADINLEAIRQIESSGDNQAISYRGAKYGRGAYQISEIALADFLARNKKERIKKSQLHEEKYARRIAQWLFTKRIPEQLKRRGLKPTQENILVVYNAGIRRVKNPPKQSREYVKKYKKLTEQKAKGRINGCKRVQKNRKQNQKLSQMAPKTGTLRRGRSNRRGYIK